MSSFIGTFENKIDAKGRVSVPARFRAVLEARNLSGIALYPSLRYPCLEASGMDRIETMVSRMDDSPIPAGNDELSEFIFASAREIPFDPNGRILLPEDFRASTGLTDKAAFVGRGNRFEIWEPAAQAKMEAEQRARIMAAHNLDRAPGGSQ